MGFGLGSRSYYAEFDGWVVQFEDKHIRDVVVKGGSKITASEAYSVSYMARCSIPRLCTSYQKPKRLKKAIKNGGLQWQRGECSRKR